MFYRVGVPFSSSYFQKGFPFVLLGYSWVKVWQLIDVAIGHFAIDFFAFMRNSYTARAQGTFLRNVRSGVMQALLRRLGPFLVLTFFFRLGLVEVHVAGKKKCFLRYPGKARPRQDFEYFDRIASGSLQERLNRDAEQLGANVINLPQQLGFLLVGS